MFNIEHNGNEDSVVSDIVYQKNLMYSLCFSRPRDYCGVYK